MSREDEDTIEQRIVHAFVEEVWNAPEAARAAADLYAETYVNPFGSGPAARVEPIRRYHEAFPDLHIDIEELIVAGDTVVLRATFRGTDTVDMGKGTDRPSGARVGGHDYAFRSRWGRPGVGRC